MSRATRREEIGRQLFSAAELLLEQGNSFAEISVEQLITGAEIARSTFYVYFEDKGALLLELADRVTREVGEAATTWLTLKPGATREDLNAAVREFAGAYGRHRHMFIALADAAAYDPRVRNQYAAVMEQRAGDMAAGFREQQGAGLIPADVDVEQVAPWLMWMFERGLYQLIAQNPVADHDRLDGACSVVWETLYARGGGSRVAG